MADVLHSIPFLSNVYLGSTTTQNVLVTGWQSQVAAMLKGEGTSGTSQSYGSIIECSKAEHEAGGQGHPVELAAGAATCSHPPTPSDQPAWRSWVVQ